MVHELACGLDAGRCDNVDEVWWWLVSNELVLSIHNVYRFLAYPVNDRLLGTGNFCIS